MNGWKAGSCARACGGGLGKGTVLLMDWGGPDCWEPHPGLSAGSSLSAGHPTSRSVKRLAKKNIPEHRSMIPLFGCCPGPDADPHQAMRRHQERRLRMLRFWRDAAERQLAALDASISTLEQQMQRAAQEPQA